VQGFWDPSVPPSNFSSTLPDPLRIKSTGIQAHQMIVYEDFVVDPRRRADSRPSSVASFHTPVPYSQSPSIEDAHVHTLQSHQDAMDRFMVSFNETCKTSQSNSFSQGLTRDLEAVVLQYPTQALTTLPSNHDIRHLVRQIMLLADEARDPERTPLMMSQKIVQLLYKTTSPLGREVYVAILDQLCHNFENVAKEAITWLLYAEDEVGSMYPL
jgi:CCR4-NOT transcription complex subunit 1